MKKKNSNRVFHDPPDQLRNFVSMSLTKCKATILNQLSIHCGIPIRHTKKAQIDLILLYIEFFRHAFKTPTKLSALLIDVGLKNFSYCKVDDIDISDIRKKSVIRRNQWDKWDLRRKISTERVTFLNKHEIINDKEGHNSIIDEKKLLSHLNFEVLDKLIVQSRPQPNIVVVETQRTRSNNNIVTLPNVLKNYTFENMIYANLYTLSRLGLIDENCVVIPMNSSSMANFWVNRFLRKLLIPKDSKKLRMVLFFEWLTNQSPLPFTLENFEAPINVSDNSRRAALLAFLNKNPKEKIDDLVDSLLYNLAIRLQISNLFSLAQSLEIGDDISQLTTTMNFFHYNLIRSTIEKLNLQVNENQKH